MFSQFAAILDDCDVSEHASQTMFMANKQKETNNYVSEPTVFLMNQVYIS